MGPIPVGDHVKDSLGGTLESSTAFKQRAIEIVRGAVHRFLPCAKAAIKCEESVEKLQLTPL